MVNIKNFDELIDKYRNTVIMLVRKYNIYEFENHLLEHLWKISLGLDLNRFQDSKSLDNYIFISLKNKCINIYKKEKLYKYRNCCCYDNNEILKKDFFYKDFRFQDLEYEDITSKLKEKEKLIIDYKFKYSLSDIEIAKILNVSRQSIHKSIKKSLIKIQVRCS